MSEPEYSSQASAPVTQTSLVGFVLLSHDRSYQLRRLVVRLRQSFGDPLIVCHHDFGRTPLDHSEWPFDAVRFVRPHIPTAWGDWSAVAAAVQAFRLFAESPQRPDWLVFLSGSDYPIKPSSVIANALRDGSYDAYVEAKLVDPDVSVEWREEGLRRYYFRGTGEIDNHPFRDGMACYWGEFWLTVNRRGLDALLRVIDARDDLRDWYRGCPNPEESYLVTALCSAKELVLAAHHDRYIDWSANEPHPKILTTRDLPELLSSPAHFARKFDERVDSEVLDQLDHIVGR